MTPVGDMVCHAVHSHMTPVDDMICHAVHSRMTPVGDMLCHAVHSHMTQLENESDQGLYGFSDIPQCSAGDRTMFQFQQSCFIERHHM